MRFIFVTWKSEENLCPPSFAKVSTCESRKFLPTFDDGLRCNIYHTTKLDCVIMFSWNPSWLCQRANTMFALSTNNDTKTTNPETFGEKGEGIEPKCDHFFFNFWRTKYQILYGSTTEYWLFFTSYITLKPLSSWFLIKMPKMTLWNIRKASPNKFLGQHHPTDPVLSRIRFLFFWLSKFVELCVFWNSCITRSKSIEYIGKSNQKKNPTDRPWLKGQKWCWPRNLFWLAYNNDKGLFYWFNLLSFLSYTSQNIMFSSFLYRSKRGWTSLGFSLFS